MIKATLRELIEMAKAGKKFKAKRVDGNALHREDFFISTVGCWTDSAVMAEWEYELIIEPMVIWVNVYEDGKVGAGYQTKDEAMYVKYKSGVTKKFIEVIE